MNTQSFVICATLRPPASAYDRSCLQPSPTLGWDFFDLLDGSFRCNRIEVEGPIELFLPSHSPSLTDCGAGISSLPHFVHAWTTGEVVGMATWPSVVLRSAWVNLSCACKNSLGYSSDASSTSTSLPPSSPWILVDQPRWMLGGHLSSWSITTRSQRQLSCRTYIVDRRPPVVTDHHVSLIGAHRCLRFQSSSLTGQGSPLGNTNAEAMACRILSEGPMYGSARPNLQVLCWNWQFPKCS